MKLLHEYILMDFSGGASGKGPTANKGDKHSIPGSGRSPGEENGNPS